MKEFTHINKKGNVRMIDVTDKKPSKRNALAQSIVFMSKSTFKIIINNEGIKGNVLETARIAGIMGAKKTPYIIPMCHPINLTHIKIDFFPEKKKNFIKILGTAKTKENTGVEMEALIAVSVAALTIYDMCKSSDKAMYISDVCLLQKFGGKSGNFISKKTLSKIF